MAQFADAVDVLWVLEGGHSDHKADPGGATNFGISLRFLQSIGDLDGDGWLDGDLDRDGDVDAQDIALLTKSKAAEIYRSQFWDRYGYGSIDNQDLATRVFCLSVHAGPGRAHRILQQSIAYHQKIKVDGIIGRKTRGAANQIKASWILGEFRHELAEFYRSLIQANPELEVFQDGWLNRAYL
jgi:lysozyme family protein